MKHHSILIALALLLALGAGACTQKSGGEHGTADSSATAKDSYTCPMHPSVISDRPSACPVCGMALVKKSTGQALSKGDEAMLRTVSLSSAQRVMANIATQPAMRRSMGKVISAVGVVDFAEPLQADVTARFRGRVEKVLANFTGKTVRKGDVLLEMYSPDLIAAQQEYLNALGGASRAAQGGGVAESSQRMLLESSRDRLRVHYGLSAEQIADLEKNGKAHSTSQFRAPISGTIVKKQVLEGQYVDEGTTLYQLADLSRVWIYVEVYEQDMRFIRNGQSVTLEAEAWPGETFMGRVAFIDAVMSAETRTVRVRVDVPNPGGKLKPQMYVKASIALQSASVLAVPVSAVVSTGKRSVVWVEARTNQFEPRDVTTGNRDEGYYEITSGLSEGENVVSTGGYLLDSESLLSNPELASSASAPAGDAPAASDAPALSADGVQERTVVIDGEYAPDLITVEKGKKVRILFNRKEDAACSEEVVFKDFNIRRKLPAFKTTAIEFTPKKAGRFSFVCGMDMLKGTLVVR